MTSFEHVCVIWSFEAHPAVGGRIIGAEAIKLTLSIPELCWDIVRSERGVRACDADECKSALVGLMSLLLRGTLLLPTMLAHKFRNIGVEDLEVIRANAPIKF